MAEAVIVATARTPIGRAYKGSLIDVRPDDMAGFAIREAMAKVPALDPAEIEDVMLGCGLTHAEASFNIARPAALLAGLPDSVPGTTVNRYCASSLQTIRMAHHAIQADEGTAYVAAGVESITRTQGIGFESSHLNPRFGDESRDDYINSVYIPMGLTAENVAEQFDVSRERMDEFAKLSQDRATQAQEQGFFDAEISPYTTPDGTVVNRDDSPRAGTTIEKLATLQPVFKPGGSVTAGNSCPLNDGAAAVVVMSADRANELGITPLARIISASVSGIAPEIMGVGPIEAIGKALHRAGMKIGDIDIVELNEAFASQVLAVADETGIDVAEQLNPHGGAIALGHPYGMTGARIMTTLLNGLRYRDQTMGLETMCVGGGQGMAMVVERLS
jgi:acetyl-CoA C-acetyltransferase